MSYNWGPHFIVPSENLTTFSGQVLLREEFDQGLLEKELRELGLPGAVVKVTNPWYCRRKGETTWLKIGESADRQANFPVRWDTAKVADGQYEVLGLMHVFIKKEDGEAVIARENVVEVTVGN